MDDPVIIPPPPNGSTTKWRHSELTTHPLHCTNFNWQQRATYNLMSELQKLRNAKQERKSVGEREKKSYRNTGVRNTKEKSRNAGTRNATARRDARPYLVTCRITCFVKILGSPFILISL